MATISILTLGTRGDVEPYLALAHALRERGHDIRLAAPSTFDEPVEEQGIAFTPMAFDIASEIRNPDVARLLAGNFARLPKVWRTVVVPMISEMLAACWRAAADADLIIHHPKVFVATDIAEKTGARFICASPVPTFPTGDFPIITATRDFGPTLNRLSWRILGFSRLVYRSQITAWRARTLGLKGGGPINEPPGYHHGKPSTALCAVSPSIVPRPTDWPSDWHMTGSWCRSEARASRGDHPLDPALDAFIEAGPTPVFIGFGSMPTPSGGDLSPIIEEAVRQSGLRAVIAKGWQNLTIEEDPDRIFTLEQAPYELLFPRMRAVVHHGGAGTTMTGLAAGRPTLIFPFGIDQSFWGHRVERLGCGPQRLPVNKMTTTKLTERLCALVSDPSYERGADRVRTMMAAEDGLGAAIEVIERLI